MLKNDVAVVLMDVSMPELDGFELAEIIRQHPRFQKTAIIFISAVHLPISTASRDISAEPSIIFPFPSFRNCLRAKVSVFAELHRKTRQLERLNRELRRLSGRLITTQDEERRRFARELHDGLGQELVAAKMVLDRVLQPNSAQIKREAANDAANIIERVYSRYAACLICSIRLCWTKSGCNRRFAGIWKASPTQRNRDLHRYHPPDFPRLTPELETAIFRIIQEALTNVFRHSQARSARVTLSLQGRLVVAKVRDDGGGVTETVAEQQPGSIGIGIGGMGQRAREFGGELRLAHAHPGTLVEILIPYDIPALHEVQITA